MAEQFYTILTQVGKAKIANATALGTKVNFKEMAVGDGKGNYYNPTENQTELVNEVWRGQINHVEVDENNPNWIKISIVIPSTIGGFTIREAGIFDYEGNMIAIGKYPETYKPILEDGSSKDLLINMILEVSNAANVTLKVDPTVILATKKDIENVDTKVDNNKEEFNTFKTSTESHLADMTQQVENIDLSADKIKIADKNNKFTSEEVESALYECITKAEEAFTGADNGKKNWVDVIGSPLLNMDSFSTLKSKTQNLKNTFASNLSNKKVSASGTESLNNLISKIKNINVGKRYAEVEVLSSSVKKPFEIYNTSRDWFTITLQTTFKPETIIICNPGGYNNVTIFKRAGLFKYSDTSNQGVLLVEGSYVKPIEESETNQANLVITDTDFILPVTKGSTKYICYIYE